MEKDRKVITVYGASSSEIDDMYKAAARETGRLVACAGYALACGGGRSGLMGEAIDGAIDAGGHTIGVIPRFMAERGWGHDRVGEMVVTSDMHERKAAMMRMASGIIALPGGVGTFEELFEAITWRQLNLYHGNVVILNTGGYYDPLLEMLQRTVDLHFMRGDHRWLWQSAATPAEAVALATAPAPDIIFTQKITDRN